MATSLHVLRTFLLVREDKTVDASQIHSRACYLAWLNTRNAQDCDSERKKFHRSLTNHLSGVDGRCPFDAQEEEAILRVLRRKERWPCFPDISIGMNFRAKGFHEKQNALLATSTTAPRQPLPPSATCPNAKRIQLSTGISRESLTLDDPVVLLGKLGAGFAHLTRSFAPFGIDVRESIFGILRFVVYYRAPDAFPTLAREEQDEYARMLCANVTARLGDASAAVAVFDFLDKNALGRIVAQNAQSLDCFGEIKPGQGLDLLHFTSGADVYKLVEVLGAALFNAGTEYRFDTPSVFCVGSRSNINNSSSGGGGEEVHTRLALSQCWLDPKSSLFVGVVRPVVLPTTTMSCNEKECASLPSTAAAATTAAESVYML